MTVKVHSFKLKCETSTGITKARRETKKRRKVDLHKPVYQYICFKFVHNESKVENQKAICNLNNHVSETKINPATPIDNSFLSYENANQTMYVRENL